MNLAATTKMFAVDDATIIIVSHVFNRGCAPIVAPNSYIVDIFFSLKLSSLEIGSKSYSE